MQDPCLMASRITTTVNRRWSRLMWVGKYGRNCFFFWKEKRLYICKVSVRNSMNMVILHFYTTTTLECLDDSLRLGGKLAGATDQGGHGLWLFPIGAVALRRNPFDRSPLSLSRCQVLQAFAQRQSRHDLFFSTLFVLCSQTVGRTGYASLLPIKD